MASGLTPSPREPGFLGRLIRRVYQRRMETAMRVVKHHLQFIGAETITEPRPAPTRSAARLLFAPTYREASPGCAMSIADEGDLAVPAVCSAADPIVQLRNASI